MRVVSATPAGKKALKGTTSHRLKKPSVVSARCRWAMGNALCSFTMAIDNLDEEAFNELVLDIASREYKTSKLCELWQCTKEDLQAFVSKHRMAIELARQEMEAGDESTEDTTVTPKQLDDLWITKKFERLRRLEEVADLAYEAIKAGSYGDSTLLREFRSYLTLAANELGQLLHRGAGDAADGDTVTYEFKGVDLDNLR